MKPNSRIEELRAITRHLAAIFLTLMDRDDETYQGRGKGKGEGELSRVGSLLPATGSQMRDLSVRGRYSLSFSPSVFDSVRSALTADAISGPVDFGCDFEGSKFCLAKLAPISRKIALASS